MLFRSRIEHFQAIDWGLFVYLGIFNSVIAYLCWNTALNKIGDVKTGVIYYLMPIFGGLEAYFILGEKFYISQLSGGILIIIGIALTTLHKHKKTPS